jgi:hypothetical protein
LVSMQVLRSDYIPQLRTMEECTGEDGLPLFTEMLRAKVFSESWIFRA